MTSESIEMYLVTIAMLSEEGSNGPIPLSRLADELSVQSVSANQMIRKLDEEGLVSYLPYKGVELSERGSRRANHILRHRRLWEVFFVKSLEFSPREAEDLACRMEHDTTLEASERLAGLLGGPHVSPSGRVIPPSTGELLTGKSWRLSDLNVGQQGEVLAFQVDDATAAFLQNEGLEQGVQVVVEAVSSSGAILVHTKKKRVSITREIAENIKVKSSEAVKTYAI